MKKTISTILFLCGFVAGLFAEQVYKIAYIGNSAMPSANVAIYNGARDALKELQSRYNKKIEIEFVSQSSADNQIKKLGSSYIDGYKGTILFPISDDKNFISAVSSLTGKSYPVVLVGKDLVGSKRICYIGGDEKKFYEVLSEQLKILAGKDSLHLYIYGKPDSFIADSSAKVDAREKLYNSAKSTFNQTILDTISNGKISVELIELYSIYYMSNKISILRRDNYGEIFMSPELLGDMAPIERDTDRRFALCVGGAPHLAEYLKSGQLSACVYHDFYGWGYFSARAIAEKIFESVVPMNRNRLIKPILATPENVESFKADWQKWTK